MKLIELNRLPAAEAEAAFLDCCGSRRWAQTMVAARPFADLDAVRSRAEHEWWKLAPGEWLQAFRAHPRIGDTKGDETTDGAGRAAGWSAGEQSGVADDDGLRAELAVANRAYDERFGHLYIVCASGKSGREMLADLRARLENSADEEMRVAAGEQAAITRLRLEKLLAEDEEE